MEPELRPTRSESTRLSSMDIANSGGGREPSDEGRLLPFLFATVFLLSSVFGAFMVVVPVFAEGLGASYLDLGIMGSGGSMTYAVMTVLSGYFVDRFNRARLYAVGLLCIMVSLGLFSLAGDVSGLVILRTLLGATSALFWVVALSLVMEVSSQRHRVRALGRYNLSWVAGFIAGPTVGGVLYELLGFQHLSLVLGGVSGACAVVAALLISPRYRPSRPHSVGRKVFDASIFRASASAYLFILSYSVIMGVQMALLPGYMSDFGVSSSQIGLLMTASNGARAFAFLNAGRLMAWGRTRSLNLAVVLASSSLLGIALSRGTVAFLPPLLLIGLSGGIMVPIVQDAIAGSASDEELGGAVGLYEAMFGVGSTIGPVFAGGMADLITPEAPYLILSASALAMFLLTARVKAGGQATQEP
ncbi:hypothetical protein AC482_05705 [miscellaneous Crenarchaeota group-15 archaeon DG-45]|uniref:Major facilitator superfamily (MFS) profile domain-containing protein n=1 Tax=miscellaneous Crenarchaeota group-15 archaeon DG-45 TaxID=1685127 RepID=A0A0M0BN36_9ARCH|nr:MAG: hypothetical protein AC482_05705 [miscellaneous Crenarchaeota group-15 archaeon DG-45]